ncbi:MAG: DUF4350 domain-containing protein [Bacteroidota bacterium]|jgi:hypothetical protein
MKQSRRYGIIGGVVFVTALLFWLMRSEPSSAPSSGKSVQHISADWNARYQWQSKDPYGLFIFNELLQNRVKKDSLFSVSNSQELDSLAARGSTGTYIFIGHELGLYNQEMDTLLSLIEKGAHLILITGNVTDNIAQGFTPELEFIFDYTPRCTIRAGNEDYNMIYVYQNDTIAYPWRIIWHPGGYPTSTEVISTLSGHANFISFPVGTGSITIHSNPECFFNYQLTRRDGFRYADKLIKKIDPSKKLYYLEFARLKERDPEDLADFMEQNEKKGKRDDSYLQFLFQTPALRAALLLSLLGIILYLIFRAKRMRPAVEVMPEKRNMSEIFVSTVASIYRNKENPHSVLILHRKNFYDTVQKHFFIDLSKRTAERELRNLATRCSIEEQVIAELLVRLETEEKEKCTEDFLSETIQQKREFYRKTGIINERLNLRLDEKELVFFRPVLISFPFLLTGIFMILWGLYLLVQSIGIGIALWPVGSLVIYWSLRRLTIPVLKISKKHIVYCPSIGRIQQFGLNEVARAEKLSNGYVIHLKDSRQIVLAFSDFSSADRTLFENYLLKEKIIEL